MSQHTIQEYPKVDIKDIILDPETQIRLDRFTGVEELAADMKENKQRDPIELRRAPDGLHLVDGGRRIEAAKRNGWKELFYVETNLSLKDAIIHTVSSSLARRNLSDLEEARAFQVELNLGWTVPELVRKHGKSKEYIELHLALLQAPKKVQELSQKRQIGMKVFEKAIQPVPTPQLQELIATDIAKGHMDLEEAQEHSNDLVNEYEKEEEFKKAFAESKFQKCPACSKAPGGLHDTPTGASGIWVRCGSLDWNYDSKHIWNLQSGQTLQQLEELRQKKVREQAKTDRASMTSAEKEAEERKALRYIFRYPVHEDVIREAIMRKDIQLAIKHLQSLLSSKTIPITHLTVDADRGSFGLGFDQGFHIDITTSMLGDNKGYFEASQPLPQCPTLTVEPKRYNDPAGNLVKIKGNSAGFSSQNKIDAANAKTLRFLDSLPIIVKYKKTHSVKKSH